MTDRAAPLARALYHNIEQHLSARAPTRAPAEIVAKFKRPRPAPLPQRRFVTGTDDRRLVQNHPSAGCWRHRLRAVGCEPARLAQISQVWHHIRISRPVKASEVHRQPPVHARRPSSLRHDPSERDQRAVPRPLRSMGVCQLDCCRQGTQCSRRHHKSSCKAAFQCRQSGGPLRRRKSDFFTELRKWVDALRSEGVHLRVLRSDNGGEYIDSDCVAYLKSIH